jgi:hypothetical protein
MSPSKFAAARAFLNAPVTAPDGLGRFLQRHSNLIPHCKLRHRFHSKSTQLESTALSYSLKSTIVPSYILIVFHVALYLRSFYSTGMRVATYQINWILFFVYSSPCGIEILLDVRWRVLYHSNYRLFFSFADHEANVFQDGTRSLVILRQIV